MNNLQHVLIIDTAGLEPYVALGQLDELMALHIVRLIQIPANRCAELLVNKIEELVAEFITWDKITALVVNIGPGGWTGIRIGITVAKIIAWNNHLPILGVRDIKEAAQRIADNDFESVYALSPFYEKEPNITTPKLKSSFLK